MHPGFAPTAVVTALMRWSRRAAPLCAAVELLACQPLEHEAALDGAVPLDAAADTSTTDPVDGGEFAHDADSALEADAASRPDAAVSGTDAAANPYANDASTDAASDAGTLPELPDTLLVHGPPARTPHTDLQIQVESTHPEAEFECALDGDAALPCDANSSWHDLSLGKHVLVVTATHDGRADPTPLELVWTVVEPGARIATACVGYAHACAITTAGQLWCWGANEAGQLGLGDVDARSEPQRVGVKSDWSLVACGREHTCGVRSGELYCWGDNQVGQLGLGDDTPRFTPTSLGVSQVRALGAGDFHACFSVEDADTSCFGLNWMGRLGDGSETNRTSPSTLGGAPVSYTSLTLGAAHSCGIRDDGQLDCWGANNHLQLGAASAEACALGQGALACAKSPQRVSDSAWKVASAGNDWSCGIDGHDQLSCWGFARSGVIGTAGVEGDVSPVAMSGQWSSVSAGSLHACAIQTNGTLWCWGANGNAQLGRPELERSEVPAELSRGTLWRAVYAGTFGSCAIDQTGALWCWGQGAFSNSTTPAWIEIEGVPTR